jgi:hypothetical protein
MNDSSTELVLSSLGVCCVSIGRWNIGLRLGRVGSIVLPSGKLRIKPGSDPKSINLGSRGVLPVALLTTDDFDDRNDRISSIRQPVVMAKTSRARHHSVGSQFSPVGLAAASQAA